MSSDKPFIYQLLDRDSIYDSIFDNLSPRNIFHVGRASRFSRQAVRDYKSRAWDIDKHLERYFTDPIGFRVLQAQTSAIICGSSAVQFFDRDFYPSSNLDLYVDIMNAAAVCTWIEDHGGREYHFGPTELQKNTGWTTSKDVIDYYIKLHVRNANNDLDPSNWSGYEEASLMSILNFWSKVYPGSGRKHIQVIVSEFCPMSSVMSFHSTVVMNVLTYRAAYSFFPNETFEKRRIMTFASREIVSENAMIKKYTDRGWELFCGHSLSSLFFFNPRIDEFCLGKRWVGDSKTWVLPFDLTEVENRIGAIKSELPTPLSCDPLTLNSFSVTFSYSTDDTSLDFDIVNPPFFRNSYTASPDFSLKLTNLFRTLREDMSRLVTVPKRNDYVLSILIDISKHHCYCDFINKRDGAYSPPSRWKETSNCEAFNQMKPFISLLLQDFEGEKLFENIREKYSPVYDTADSELDRTPKLIIVQIWAYFYQKISSMHWHALSSL